MQGLIFLLVGIFLYFFSDQVLRIIESRLGRRLEQRSVVFFAILLLSAMVSFTVIETFLTG